MVLAIHHGSAIKNSSGTPITISSFATGGSLISNPKILTVLAGGERRGGVRAGGGGPWCIILSRSLSLSLYIYIDIYVYIYISLSLSLPLSLSLSLSFPPLPLFRIGAWRCQRGQ